ncbi:MAG: DUF4215 domain-containing protein, partial [Myxococcales bacterium]|nr:DUF4215 domain-containing protein [Myxococcales bacterium]
MQSPAIDVSAWERVRLQYRRWLTIEDGFYDQATITANGQQAWANFAGPDDFDASNHHIDHEWRFHDVEVTPFVSPTGEVQLAYNHFSDGGLEFGGWTVDEVCLVGHGQGIDPPDPPDPPDPGNDCGDGIVGQFEQCDDGNLENGDGCSAGCLWENDGSDDVGTDTDTGDDAGLWEPGSRGCGCTSDAPGSPERGAL